MDIAEISETTLMPADWREQNNIHVLQVKGDSLEADHLRDGDRVIVEKRATPKDGDLVVVRIGNGESTLRRFSVHGAVTGVARPNPAGEVSVLDGKDVTIQGVVVGILRKYRD